MLGIPFLIAQASEEILTEQSSFWSTIFSGIDEGQRFVLILVAIGCITAIVLTTVGGIIGFYSSLHKNRLFNELKQDMLDRGMSAKEIAEVVKAVPAEDSLSRWAEYITKR